MSKISKEDLARFSGANWALAMCEKNGIEYCRKELDQRGTLNIPLAISKAALHEFENRTRLNILNTVLLMSVSVMLDEFEFDRDMLARFIDRFNLKTECLNDDFINWEELQGTLDKEINIKLPLADEILNLRKDR